MPRFIFITGGVVSSLGKGLGAASFGLDYKDTDEAGGTTNDTENWRFSYIIGF